MLWYALTIGLSQAAEDSLSPVGLRIEHLPLPDNLSGLNSALNRWTPWVMYNHQYWNIKGTFMVNGQFQQSKTSETTEQTQLYQTLLGIEGERILSSGIFEWNVGLGVQSNIPVVKQYSSQFTESEQEDVDVQTQNQQAELSFTSIRIPCTVQIPIQKHLQIGLGLQTSYIIQRSESDFTTYLNTSWYTSPILMIAIR